MFLQIILTIAHTSLNQAWAANSAAQAWFGANQRTSHIHYQSCEHRPIVQCSDKLKLPPGCRTGSPGLVWHKIQEPLTLSANVLKMLGVKAHTQSFVHIIVDLGPSPASEDYNCAQYPGRKSMVIVDIYLLSNQSFASSLTVNAWSDRRFKNH